jgi:hypothetical protein
MLAQESKSASQAQVGAQKAIRKESESSFEKSMSQFKMKPYPEPKGPLASEVVLGGSLPDTQPAIQQKTEEEEPLQGKGNIQLKEDEEEPMQGKGNIQLAQGLEEEEPLQGKGNIQLKEDEEPLQGKGNIQLKEDEDPLQGKGNIQLAKGKEGSTNSTGMPNAVKSKMEGAFNTDFSDVKIHTNSEQSKQLGALAFTQGSDVHFSSGQYNPDTQSGQELLGHELTHVVQQRQGRVQPTKQGKGMSINDSPVLENEADVMGKKASQGEAMAEYASIGTVQAKNSIIQRAVATSGGSWDTDQYDLKKDDPAVNYRGLDIKLKFSPGDKTDAELIGITQSVQAVVSGATSFVDVTKEGRSISQGEAKPINTGTSETDEGTAIDQLSEYKNPMYATGPASNTDTLSSTATDASWGQHGWHYKDNAKKLQTQDATLIDKPRRPNAAKNSRHIFEATALALKGSQNGTYYGSVRWGWRTDNAGKFEKIPLEVVSQGVPSSTFMKAAKKWNASKTSPTSGNVDTIKLPVVAVKIATAPITQKLPNGFIGPPLQIPANTRVQIIKNAVSPSVNGQIKVVDGTYTGMTIDVAPADMANLKNER